MFIAGANQKHPELRAASIKGVMRYFFRAVMNYPNTEQLFTEEGKLFGCVKGSDGQQSGLRIQVLVSSPNIGDEAMLPHRLSGNPMMQQAIRKGTTFSVTLRSFSNSSVNHALYEALFELTVLLGGFGRRSRRGFGSVMIERKNDANYLQEGTLLQQVFNLLQVLSPGLFHLDTASSKIVRMRRSMAHYPYIEEIQETTPKANVTELLRHYGQQAHNTRSTAPLGFKLTGSIEGGRYASPVYCTAFTKTQGLVIKLHAMRYIQDNNVYQVHLDHQKTFIDNVLR